MNVKVFYLLPYSIALRFLYSHQLNHSRHQSKEYNIQKQVQYLIALKTLLLFTSIWYIKYKYDECSEIPAPNKTWDWSIVFPHVKVTIMLNNNFYNLSKSVSQYMTKLVSQYMTKSVSQYMTKLVSQYMTKSVSQYMTKSIW